VQLLISFIWQLFPL